MDILNCFSIYIIRNKKRNEYEKSYITRDLLNSIGKQRGKN